MKHLKKIRVTLALCVFLLILLHFLDTYDLVAHKYVNWVFSLQIVPALMRLSSNLIVPLLILIIVLFITLLFGRIYCSVICPLGIFQDVIIRIKRWIKPKIKYKYRRSQMYVHYGIMVMSIGLWLAGSAFLLTLLDPYSNFGRITGSLIKPVIVQLNNFITHQLHNWDIYVLHTVDYKIVIKGLVYSLLFLGTITWLSLWRGRLFCNLICPVGGILSIISRYGILKLRITASACSSCGKCMQACKAECISTKDKKIDFSRCISCYNCIENCDNGAIQFVNVFSDKKVSATNNKPLSFNRRYLITGTLGMGLTLTGLAQPQQHKHRHRHAHNNKVHQSPHPVTPPGSGSLMHFNEKCTACQLCVSRCPTNVLQPTLFDYGFFNMSQPRMNYMVNYCSFDCTVCADVCPTGAIQSLTMDEKHTCQIGKVHFIKRECVVHTDLTACGSCSEHCPTQAVYMVPYKGDLTIPEVNPDICVGCGACEYACPVLPQKAIIVKANTIHQIAEKPATDKLEFDAETDFPF
ncbi:MAG: 4Fe-4S dicluster domain-containing protein [Bacteroidetes bacterium]|jgi:ferredoxin|nr:4Fe-4S dicluster domain-containing protein [Bacteroidota bacterium]